MHLAPLIRDLALILGIAGITGFLFKKIRQPVVLGYLLAGFIIGPHTARVPLVTDMPNIQVWGELGVIFVMFSLGLDFSFRKLVRVGPSAGITTLGEVVFMLLLGYGAGSLLGWRTVDCFFLGGILAISSTTIIFKTFDELGLRTRHFAERVFAVLVVEDIAAVLLLVGLTVVSMTQTLWDVSLVYAALRLVTIVGGWFLVGYFVVPSVMRRASRHLDSETLIVVAVGLCLLMVVAASNLGYSAALGAFIMGSILAETREAERIESLIQPVRQLFAAVFFVSVGMLVNPTVISENPGTIALLTITLILGKIVGVTVSAVASGQTLHSGLQMGFSLAQIGEFSFIIASLGSRLGVTSDFLYTVAVAVSGITTFTTPFLVRWSGPFADWFHSKLPPNTQTRLMRYSSWMQQPAPARLTQNGYRTALVRFVINGILVTLLFAIFSRWGLELLEQWAPDFAYTVLLCWGLTIGVAAPFVWGMFFAFRPQMENRPGLAALPSFIAHLATVGWIGLLSAAFFATAISFALTLCLALVLFLLSYRGLEQAYHRLERHLIGNILPASTSQPDPLVALAPWDLHLVRVWVHPSSPLGGQTLAQAAVRQKFGLIIVAIQRGSVCVPAPGANSQIFPQDTLLVLGTDKELDAFRAVVESPAPDQDSADLAEFTLQRVLIDSESELSGKSIRDSGVRQTLRGLIVGLESGSLRTTNPEPQRVLQIGDVLWVVTEPAPG